MDGSLTHDVLTAIVSAVASVVTTLAVFRSRLDVMDAQRAADRELWQLKLDQVTSQVERIAEEGARHFKTSERLQRAVLTMVASIASKEGADHRTPNDVLTRFLTEEQK